MSCGWARSSSSTTAASEPRAPRPAGAAQQLEDRPGAGRGGFTGGVYEIGALRALDLLAVNQTVNEFDVYVGTSAGAFIASLTANGVTPEEMMRVLNKDLRSPIPDIDLGCSCGRTTGLPPRLGLPPVQGRRRRQRAAREPGESSAVDLVTGLAAALPPGLYRGTGIERYVEEVLSDPDRTNDFRHLSAELYLTATDLDTTERVILGEGEWADVPISKGSPPPARCR